VGAMLRSANLFSFESSRKTRGGGGGGGCLEKACSGVEDNLISETLWGRWGPLGGGWVSRFVLGRRLAAGASLSR